MVQQLQNAVVFQCRPMFNEVLNFADKPYKSIYDDGCLPVTKYYDVNEDGLVTTFRSKQNVCNGEEITLDSLIFRQDQMHREIERISSSQILMASLRFNKFVLTSKRSLIRTQEPHKMT